VKRIPLTQGKVALVSDQDYWLVRKFTWCAHKEHRSWYAVTGDPQIKMHRLLASFPPFDLDHKNGHGLDNRRSNLRPASKSENGANRKKQHSGSGYKGVYKQRKNWIARIKVRGKRINLGTVSSVREARILYAQAAKKYFGKFARTE
jgi:hypothetical protein